MKHTTARFSCEIVSGLKSPSQPLYLRDRSGKCYHQDEKNEVLKLIGEPEENTPVNEEIVQSQIDPTRFLAVGRCSFLENWIQVGVHNVNVNVPKA